MAAEQTDRKPLLSLSTFVDRPTIVIDDHPYEIRNAEEFAPIQYAHLTRCGRRLQEIEALGDIAAVGTFEKLDDATAGEYAEIYARMCRLALIADEDVLERLTYNQHKAVVAVFLGRSLETNTPVTSANQAARPVTGGRPSRVSPGSIQGSRRTRG